MCQYSRTCARRLLIAGAAMGVWAAISATARAENGPGPMTVSPAQLAAEEVASAELAAMIAEPEEPVSAARPPEEPAEPAAGEPVTTQPAEEEGPPSWPTGLLQDALGAIGLKKPMEDLGLRAYGYVETSFTGRIRGGQSRHQGNRQPVLWLRSFDAHDFNELLLNQLKFTLDRPVDTKKSFDLGGRFDYIFGSDARYTRAYGLFNDDVHTKPPFRNTNDPDPWPFNHRALNDITQMYAEMWIKTGCAEGEGLDIIFGKWVTPMGAEVIDSPSNYLFSRGLLFSYAIPFTHTGVKATYSFNPTNNVYFAAVRGWDNFKDNNDGASWMSGFLWSSKKQVGSNPLTSFALNTIVGPEQFSDPRVSGLGTRHANPGNRFVVDAIWTYRFTEKLTQVVNADFGYEDDVPNAIDNRGVVRKRDSDWYGVAYYLNYVFNEYVNGTVRAEWFRDHYGVRTGFQGDFYEVTTGLTITPFPKTRYLNNLMIRPEFRWDFSANNAPFATKGRDDCQMTAAIDVIYKF